jgi:hypothetical protein
VIAGAVVVFAGALIWLCAVVFRAARPLLTRSTSDRPAALVAFAARCLAAERPEWGQAMLAEIGAIEGASARWRLAPRWARASPAHLCPGTHRRRPPWHPLLRRSGSSGQ